MSAKFSASLAALFVVAGLFVGQALAFSPARTVPDEWDRIGVWVDQLNSLTTAQQQFAATHYVGTQKQTSNLIDAIRTYNPNFLMIQYRLGVRDSGDQTTLIHNNTWSTDWSSLDPHEDYFVHVTGNNTKSGRVYLTQSGIHEYIMDISGTINGNTTNGWKEWWGTEVLADITASHGDGVFADSSHLPYNISSNNTPLGATPCTAYIPNLNAWYAYEYARFDAANMYFIPNIGALTTTADTTTGYYTNVHGAMVEGFATQTSDWSMQANRELNLLRNGKIWIAQSSPADFNNADQRLWYVTNFLLLKQHKIFLNEGSSTGNQCAWLPEYDVPLGSPAAEGVPTDVSNLKTGSVYKRIFDRGIVLVNPTGSTVTYTFTGSDPRYQVTPSGGGAVGSDGSVTGSLAYNLVTTTTITIPAWSGRILTINPGDASGDGLVNGADYTLIADHFSQSVTAASNGDLTGDGKVTIADYNLWKSYYVSAGGDASQFAPLPEPASLTLLALAGLAALRKRR